MTSMLDQFRSAVLQDAPLSINPQLQISESGALATYYAPFEHVNTSARVVLVGITPGLQQAHVALSDTQTGSVRWYATVLAGSGVLFIWYMLT